MCIFHGDMKYQFQSNPGNFAYRPALFTSAIKILVSINIGIFLLQTLSRVENLFFPLFGLVPKLVWSEVMIWQPFTYLFFHGGVWHVLINMFVFFEMKYFLILATFLKILSISF